MVVHAYNPSYSGGWGRRITLTQGAEVAVSRDGSIALHPGQQERNSVSKKKKSPVKDSLWKVQVKPTYKRLYDKYILAQLYASNQAKLMKQNLFYKQISFVINIFGNNGSPKR